MSYLKTWALVSVVCGVFLLTYWLLSGGKPPLTKHGVPYAFANIYNPIFAPKYPTAYLRPDGSLTIMQNECVNHITLTNKTTLIVNTSNLVDSNNQSITFDGYQPSDDGRYVLLTSQQELWLYDSQTTIFKNVSENAEVAEMQPSASSIAFTSNGNVYLYNTTLIATQLVTQNQPNLYCGSLDPLYQTIYDVPGKLEWSVDGMHLLFLCVNESNLSQLTIQTYQNPKCNSKSLPFPLAGETLPLVSLGQYDVENNLFEIIEIDDQFVIDFHGINSTHFALKTTNRGRNVTNTYFRNFQTKETFLMNQIKSTTYLKTPTTQLRLLSDMTSYVDVIPFNNSQHIALFNGTEVQMLTTASEWQVTAIVSASSVGVFFIGTQPQNAEVNSGLQRTLRSVSFATHKITQLLEINLHPYQSAAWIVTSSTGGALVLRDEANATVAFYSIDEDMKTIELVQIVEPNTQFFKAIDPYAMPPFPSLIEIPGNDKVYLTAVNQTSYVINANILVPQAMDWSYGHTALVVLDGYPGSQIVDYRIPYGTAWSGFFTYLVCSENFLVFKIDPLGTGFRGATWEQTSTFLRHGPAELGDLMSTLKFLTELPYVKKVIVCGRGYGGYIATLAAAQPNIQKLADAIIAISPMATWESSLASVEPFMGTPQNNAEGYQNGSLLETLKQTNATTFVKNYLLVHGTADTVVPYSQAQLIFETLEQQRIPFDHFPMTNKDHSDLLGSNCPPVLWTKLATFLNISQTS